ncbi:MAG: co-chaperone GroES [Nanoarchaeota archaeon]|nr:co-chaperone GroES [Nanoarchaeota archaeon]
MKLIPIGERVVLKPLENSEERTSSGIYLPKSEDKKQGIVVEIGTLKDGSLIPLKKGDKVLYGGYSSEEFENNGEKLLIIEFKDIVARLEE